MGLQLEPRPTTHLVVRAQPELIAEIDRIASNYQRSRSEVTRALIRHGLKSLDQQEG
jgi:metal-responsive CopG/Arc/MetJ family transcriptional regulator